MNGTLNDVYGVKRVHRLSVMINQNGDIKTIYCVPCGPLSYLQQSEDSSSTASNDLKDTKEEEYTKVFIRFERIHMSSHIHVYSILILSLNSKFS